MKKSLCFISLVLASQGFVSFLPAPNKWGEPRRSELNNDTNPYASSAVVPQQANVCSTPKVQVTFTTFSGDDPLMVANTAAQFARHLGLSASPSGNISMPENAGLGLGSSNIRPGVDYESRAALTYPNGEISAKPSLLELPAPASLEVTPDEQWSFKRRSSETSGLGWSTQPVQELDQFLPRQNGWTTPSNSFLHEVSEGEDCYSAERPQAMDQQSGTRRRREKTSNTKLRHADSLRVSRSGEDAVLTKPVRRAESSRQPSPYAGGLSSQGDQHFGSQTLPGRGSKRRPSKAVATNESQTSQYLSVGHEYGEEVLGGYGPSSSRSTNSDDVRKSRKHSKKTKEKASKETSDLSSPLPPTRTSHAPPSPPPPPLPGPSSAPKLPTASELSTVLSGPPPDSVNNNADSQKNPLQGAGQQQSADLMEEIRKGKKLMSVSEAEKMREEKKKKAQNDEAPAGTLSPVQKNEPQKNMFEELRENLACRKTVFQKSDSEDDSGQESDDTDWDDNNLSSASSTGAATAQSAAPQREESAKGEPVKKPPQAPEQNSGDQAPTALQSQLKKVLKPGGKPPLSRKPAAETSRNEAPPRASEASDAEGVPSAPDNQAPQWVDPFAGKKHAEVQQHDFRKNLKTRKVTNGVKVMPEASSVASHAAEKSS